MSLFFSDVVLIIARGPPLLRYIIFYTLVLSRRGVVVVRVAVVTIADNNYAAIQTFSKISLDRKLRLRVRLLGS